MLRVQDVSRFGLVALLSWGLSASQAVSQVGHLLTPPPAQESERSLFAALERAQPAERLNPAPLGLVNGVPQLSAMTEAEGTPRIAGGSAGIPMRVTIADDPALAAAPSAPGPSVTQAPSQGSGRTEAHGDFSAFSVYHYNDYLEQASLMYPYRAAGRLLFTFNERDWYACSASLIDKAILVTAGHCVHQGGTGANGWIRRAMFFPSYDARRGLDAQLFGRCDVIATFTTNGWFNVGGLGMGYDVATAACGPIYGAVRTPLNGRAPGRAVGHFGFCWENCRVPYHFLTQLGYPGNYYGGGRMTTSQHLSVTGQINPIGGMSLDYMFGTGMEGGSSGGPHISNIGTIEDGSGAPGQLLDRNVVYAVTSWGYRDPRIKIGGASPLSGGDNDNNFRTMFNQTCNAARRAYGTGSVCRLLR